MMKFSLINEAFDVPLSPEVARHNAYTVGWTMAANDIRYGMEWVRPCPEWAPHKPAFLAGWEAGKAARAKAWEGARNWKEGTK